MAASEDTMNEKKMEAEPTVSPLFGSCPIPIYEHKQIVLGHGSGGKLTADLIDKVFLPAFHTAATCSFLAVPGQLNTRLYLQM